MKPLAERMRPRNLDDFFGQDHLVGPKGVVRKLIQKGQVPSMIFWGPPGVGKTTLAKIIAQSVRAPYYELTAISSGVKDLREVIKKAQNNQFFDRHSPILFVDEVHRFNKGQQDALLKAVEEGDLVLIGATTENPSFEVVNALLSRCQIYTLESLSKDELYKLMQHAITKDEYFGDYQVEFSETEALMEISGGDARKLLNALEILINQGSPDQLIKITNKRVQDILQKTTRHYDKGGEFHYDVISAFIKSVRGSDPNAAVYWLARMIDGGEDVKFIARRMIILAAEDIGLANPNALLLANACFDAAHKIGLPEARIPLSQCAIYLANSEKSNSAYKAINEAIQDAKKTMNDDVPLHLRNAPTQMMKNLGYGVDYKYAHDYDGHFVDQQYLPDSLKENVYYRPAKNQSEKRALSQLKERWPEKYD